MLCKLLILTSVMAMSLKRRPAAAASLKRWPAAAAAAIVAVEPLVPDCCLRQSSCQVLASLIQIQIVGEVFQIHVHVLLPFINQKYLSPSPTICGRELRALLKVPSLAPDQHQIRTPFQNFAQSDLIRPPRLKEQISTNS